MRPITPESLLKTVKIFLNIGGGIKRSEELGKITTVMKKYSKKLVSKCIYIKILMSTDLVILKAFLEQNGWQIIHGW